MRRERVIPVPPRRDPELAMTRELSVPTDRGFRVGAQVRLSTWADDVVIDRLLGYDGPLSSVGLGAAARRARRPRVGGVR